MKGSTISRLTSRRGVTLLLAVFAATGVYFTAVLPASMQDEPHCGSGELRSFSKHPDVLLEAAVPLSPATIKTYTGTLSGTEEVPPSGSAGTGSVTVTINTATHMMRVQANFSGLSGTTTAAHIHCCSAFGTNAGVATTTPSFSGFPLGVTSGTFDQTYDMTLASSYNPAYVTANGGTTATAEAALFAGINSFQAYFNVHTSTFGGGEIRGQLGSPSRKVVSGSGTTTANATTARDTFRTDLGGGTVLGANGSFGGVRREINWDGVPAAASAPNNMAANFFNSNSPRGAVFSTPGTGLQVSGATSDAGAGQPAAANFGNINPTYTAAFGQFSPQRLFTAVGSNIVDVNFFVPGTATPALTRGFGAVFSDVDTAGSTTITLFDVDNVSLGTYVVPAQAGTATFSFLGVSFAIPIVSRVRIVSGNGALGAAVNDGATDVVVMDDFIYGEPASTTAAGVSVSGYVLSPDGRGVRSAKVTISDANGGSRTVITGARGSFSFTDVAVGQTYIVSVGSRRYLFDPVVLNVNDNVSDLVFVASQ